MLQIRPLLFDTKIDIDSNYGLKLEMAALRRRFVLEFVACHKSLIFVFDSPTKRP